MKLIETTISETTVRMRYADDADPAKATEWVDFQAKNQDLKLPNGTTLTKPEPHPFAALKLAALRHVLGVVDAEIARIRDQLNRIA